MTLTEGQVSDYKGAALLMDALPDAEELLADRGYDADWFRDALLAKALAHIQRPVFRGPLGSDDGEMPRLFRAGKKALFPVRENALHALHSPGLVLHGQKYFPVPAQADRPQGGNAFADKIGMAWGAKGGRVQNAGGKGGSFSVSTFNR